MFTGLVKDKGLITNIKKNKDGLLITIKTTLINEIQIDDSVSVDGVCQTVIKTNCSSDCFEVQAISTTLEKTIFKEFKSGKSVNLELALRLSDRLGGHLVSGHVNDTGVIRKIKKNDKSILMEISYPENLQKYLISEGSITVNGVSLTIASLSQSTFTLALIPHTLHETNLGDLTIGARVNLEVDILAKYIENFLTKKDRTKMTVNRIKELGF